MQYEQLHPYIKFQVFLIFGKNNNVFKVAFYSLHPCMDLMIKARQFGRILFFKSHCCALVTAPYKGVLSFINNLIYHLFIIVFIYRLFLIDKTNSIYIDSYSQTENNL